MNTDLEDSTNNLYFKDKEGKYYASIIGESTSLSNLDPNQFSVQGLGTTIGVNYIEGAYTPAFTLTIQDDPNG